MEDSRAFKLEETLYLFHHVFLPPKLPQAEDYNAGHEHLLLDSVIEAIRSFSKYVSNVDTNIVRQVTEMIARLIKAHDPHGDVDEKQLMKTLITLPIEGKHCGTQLLNSL